MNPNVLILITDDPRVSARPVEAVRIAAGLSAWGGLKVHVVFHGAAARLLDEASSVVDGAALGRWLPTLRQHGARLFRSAGDPSAPARTRTPDTLACEELDGAGLARLSAESRCLLRF